MDAKKIVGKIEAAKNNFAEGKKRPTEEQHYRAFCARREFLGVQYRIQEIHSDCKHDDHAAEDTAEVVEMIASVFRMAENLNGKYTPEEIYLGLMFPDDVVMTDRGPFWQDQAEMMPDPV